MTIDEDIMSCIDAGRPQVDLLPRRRGRAEEGVRPPGPLGRTASAALYVDKGAALAASGAV